MARRKLRNMEEFSEVTGLSRPTVSKYFADPGSVRASTRARIEAALAAYDYRPNFLAQNQNRRRPRTLALVVPTLTDPFYAELIRQVETKAQARGLTVLTLASHGLAEDEARAIEMARALNIGGVILSPLGRVSDAGAISALAEEVPTLLIDSQVDGNHPFLATDHAQGITLITDYLIETGSPPCFLAMPEVNSTGAERRAGYEAAMRAHGLVPRVVENPHEGWDFEQQGRAIGREAFAGGGFPSTTILCGNDRFAIGVLAAAAEAGLRVGPEGDIRVAGHDNHPQAEFTCPGLTTVEQDYEGLAAHAVEMIEALMEGGTVTEPLRLPGRLVKRGSA